MRRTTIGGQAIIEGIMMRNKEKFATAIRKSDGDIVLDKREYHSLTEKFKILGLPIIRGGIFFIETMVFGMQILTLSADYYEVEDEENSEPGKVDQFMEKVFGDKLQEAIIFISVALALLFSVALFFVLPAFLSQFLQDIVPSTRWLNLVDGLLRLVILMIYFGFVSRLKDIQRVFMYHGAEHKCINCYEAEDELTVENVKKHSRFHKRCGTNFIFIVVAVSILVLMLIDADTLWLRIGVRILCLPLIAGISYELLRIFGANDNKVVNFFTAPGMALQRITTNEPDDDQIEIAITAFKIVEDVDNWSIEKAEKKTDAKDNSDETDAKQMSEQDEVVEH